MGNEIDWEQTYRRYTRLQQAWSVDDAPEPVARQFFQRILHGHATRTAIHREFVSFRLRSPPDDLLDEAFALQRTIYPPDVRRPDGRHDQDPMENVYAAALSMLPHGFWVESPDRDQVYRGQANAAWRTIPSLFRGPGTADALDRLGSAVIRIRTCLPDVDEIHAVAVAQHYARELGVSTWLLDVTYDPRIALFFASLDGRAGELGVVCAIVRKEWEQLSAGGTNRLGRLHVIDVPGVLRIERQRASFLDTSHPDLFDQYVAHRVWFRQVPGMVFEDREADHPVTAGTLYPADDPLLTALRRVTPKVSYRLATGPAGDAGEPLNATAYEEIAQSWCRQAGAGIDTYRQHTLRVVCDVHARLQTLRDEFELPERSLARLEDAVEMIINAQRGNEFITPREALRLSLDRRTPAGAERLMQVITECAEAAGPLLTSADALRERLVRLDRGLRSLPGRRVALLGFQDADATRVEENLNALLTLPEWTVLDLRVAAPDAHRTLAAALTAEKLALVVSATAKLPAEVELLIRALHDKRDSVRWMSGTQTGIPARRILYVIAAGAVRVEELPPVLARIDFLDFVRPPID